MEQGSAEWIAAKCGWVGASRVADIIAKTKSGWGASRANYMAQLVAERLTGVPLETFASEAMKRGIETEAEARAAYQFETTTLVEKVGFIPHPTVRMSGASPDGLIGSDGLVEIKCPNVATHVDTLLGQSVPGRYVTQMQWQMACTGRAWCDFASYDPRLPEAMRLFVKRVPRNDETIKELEGHVTDFLAELDAKIAALGARYGVQEVKRAA